MIRRLACSLLVVAAARPAAAAAWMCVPAAARLIAGFPDAEVFVDLPAGRRRAGHRGPAGRGRGRARRADLSAGGAARRAPNGGCRRASTGSRMRPRPSRSSPGWSAATSSRATVTFPEGLTIREMAAIFEGSGLGTADAFVRGRLRRRLIADLDPDARDARGLSVSRHVRAAAARRAPTAVRAMVARFDRAFDPDLRAAAAAAGLSPREVVTLASIVEKETAAPTSGRSSRRSIATGCRSACRCSAIRR